jgi:hypothetical protein
MTSDYLVLVRGSVWPSEMWVSSKFAHSALSEEKDFLVG